MSTADDVSIVALVIAVMALTTAVLQALQQYLSTSEGYRKCRADVIGKWSTLVESKFYYRNLRYETIFSTPHITMQHPVQVSEDNHPLLIGHEDLPGHTTSDSGIASVRASWVPLLEKVEAYQNGICAILAVEPHHRDQGLERGHNEEKCEITSHWRAWRRGSASAALSIPMARPIKISWDFMP